MKIDWPTYLIVLYFPVGPCLWILWCTPQNIDPVGWFR